MCLFTMNITKIAYHDPRPYMTDPTLEAWGSCSEEYGNVSGHSLFAAGAFTFAFLEFAHGKYH